MWFLYDKFYVSPLKNYVKELEKEREIFTEKLSKELKNLMEMVEVERKETLPKVFEEAKKILSDEFSLKEERNKIEIEIQTDDIFEPGGYKISKKGEEKLYKLYEFLTKINFREIEVGVHTDRTPVKNKGELFPTNWELSARRATEILRYLIQKGIPEEKIYACGYGSSRPIEKSLKIELQKKNRRAVFKIYF
jgi:chemotaxis protein MotB